MREKKEAISLIKGVVPDEMRGKVNYQSLTLSPDTYVGEQLQKTFTDIVYDGYYGSTPIKVAFIIEHKSQNPQHNIRLQLLQYFLNVVQMQIVQKIKPPALPVLIVLYHDKEPMKNEPLSKLFGREIPVELERFIPLFDIIASDFTTYDNEKIKTLFDSLKIRMENATSLLPIGRYS